MHNVLIQILTWRPCHRILAISVSMLVKMWSNIEIVFSSRVIRASFIISQH